MMQQTLIKSVAPRNKAQRAEPQFQVSQTASQTKPVGPASAMGNAPIPIQ
ncbi:hypothetical protein GCM10027217_24270 [Pseudomaricurvus hydrocarbonicus]